MAVKFEEDKFIIEVPTHSPIENWLVLQSGLLNLLSDATVETQGVWMIPQLLSAMQPNLATARKMEGGKS